ncbi:hypothetical protein K493DRAFT_221393 [Basidiobolus meristosporus CBS 931.73]|uniref:Uncharacterized protein n=1 Tax=Basidiobolus meristosporus CBS 931.73 TaxID=1314790 RepID=A0A1Y1Y9H0_9FUNG|nr:hypothetical protein K493DRAFT_221393 [Basidiobolus meristosporus CBS 931.73]|eukprot:ORX94386.1 hypothetical protein K493DRAFT_221393 [Basidiobolus meristosporus CBS 931.73]
MVNLNDPFDFSQQYSVSDQTNNILSTIALPPTKSTPKQLQPTPTTTIHQNPVLTTSFDEIQNELKRALDHIEQGAILKAFEILSAVTDAVVTNCDALGLTIDEPPYNAYDREGFWQGINHCWLYALSRTAMAKSEEDQLRVQHFYHLRDSIVSWCDHLERYGLVDYEMGFWEQDILEAIEASMSTSNLRLTSVVPQETSEVSETSGITTDSTYVNV